MQDSDEHALVVTSPAKRDPLLDFHPERRAFVSTVEEGMEPIPPVDWTTTDVQAEVCAAPSPARRPIVDQFARAPGLLLQDSDEHALVVTSPAKRDPLSDFPPERRAVFNVAVQEAIEPIPPADVTTINVQAEVCAAPPPARSRRTLVGQLARVRGLSNRFWRSGVRRLDSGAPWRPLVIGSFVGAMLVFVIAHGTSVRLPRLNSTNPAISAGAGSSTAIVAPSPQPVAVPSQSTVAVTLPEKVSIVQPAAPVSADPRPRRVESAKRVTSNPSLEVGRLSKPVLPVETVRFRGFMTVASTPPAARVFVNGQRVGDTPLDLQELPVGSRALRVEADGYAPWSSVVRVVADQRTHVTITLVPIQSDSGH